MKKQIKQKYYKKLKNYLIRLSYKLINNKIKDTYILIKRLTMNITFVIEDEYTISCPKSEYNVANCSLNKFLNYHVENINNKWKNYIDDGRSCTKDMSYFYNFKSYEWNINTYINNILVNDKNKCMREFIHDNENNIEIKFIKHLTLRRELSEKEYNSQIENYLNEQNIIRGCWFVKDLEMIPVNINKSFNCYEQTTFFGFLTHKKQCNIEKCDLIQGIINFDQIYAYKARYNLYNVKIIKSKIMKCCLRLPMISNKFTILEAYIHSSKDMPDNEYSNKEFSINDFTFNNDLTLKTIDLNLYNVSWFYYIDACEQIVRKNYYPIKRIYDDNNFVLNYCRKNEETLHNFNPRKGYKYVISYKSMLSKEFCNMINDISENNMISDLTDIVYEYVDFKSKEPVIEDFYKT